jgi:hypothetical protein
MPQAKGMHWHDQLDERTRRVAESTDLEEIRELREAAEHACLHTADRREAAAWAELARFASRRLAQLQRHEEVT